MAWIEYHEALWDFWKVKRLALRLEISYPHALGLLSCLWLWAVRNAKTGVLKKFGNDELAAGARWSGTSQNDGVGLFTKALLIECELLDQRTEKLHDWDLHGTRLLDAARQRVKKHRGKKDAT